jgi:hypothetical protein
VRLELELHRRLFVLLTKGDDMLARRHISNCCCFPFFFLLSSLPGMSASRLLVSLYPYAPPLQCQHAVNRTAPPCSSSVKTSRNRYRPFQAQPTCSFLWGAVSKCSPSRSVARSVKKLLNKWIAD